MASRPHQIIASDSEDDDPIEIVHVHVPHTIQGPPITNGRRFSASTNDPFIGQRNLLHMIIRGRPTPKDRPRIGQNGHFYNPTSALEADFRDVARRLCYYHCGREEVVTNFRENIRGSIVFAYSGLGVADIDNLLKFVMDSLQGLLYENDVRIKKMNIEVIDFDLSFGGSGYTRINLLTHR